MSKIFEKKFVLIVVLFGIIYSLISLVNHYCFRTAALDLGAYTNALYDYIHFQWNDSTVFKSVGENLLSDHFDLYLIVFSPLSLIFGTYTLLVVQIVSVLFGGIGVYKFFNLLNKPTNISLYATIYFYLFFGVFSALSFDYHSNVIAATLIPWIFYLLKKRKILATSFLLLFILISKENTSLWLAFVCLGLIIEYRKDAYLRNYLAFASVFSFLYFLLVISVIMPAFSNKDLYPHFNYSVLGGSFFEAFIHIFQHPIESFKVLFTNHINSEHGDYIKAELHILLITSGLPFLIKKPQYILMLLPIYFQKLFHDNYNMWGIGGQYSVEFAPILAIGVFMVVSDFKSVKLIRITSIVVLFFVLVSTLRIMDNTVLYTNKSAIRFYQANHYYRKYDIGNIYKQLSKIPKYANVSAQSAFLPHLALRDNIYQFPMIKDAEYVVYSKKELSYPLDKNAFNSITSKLENSDEWSVFYKDEELTILKRSSF